MAGKREPQTALGRYFAAFDYLQFGAMLCLIGVGLLFIYSTGVQIGGSDPSFSFRRQVLWIVIGTVFYFTGSCLNTRSILFKTGIIAFYGVILLALVAVLIAGVRVYGATRWLAVGGFRLQPSEFAKLALALALGLIFSLRGLGINGFAGLAVSSIATVVPFLLVAAEPDFGSAIVLLPLYAAVAFVADLKWKKILFIFIVIAVAAGGVIVNEVWKIRPLLRDYQRDRILVFLNPERDRLNRGYNAYQAKIAVSSGGKFGKGIGEGTQNELGFLPQTVSNNDFIFSVIAEETGFVGIVGLLACYTVLLFAILRAAYRSIDDFGRYFAVGTATVLFSHIFINIGMSLGVMPVTGLSLPFVSYGGSFLMTAMAMLGILQAIRRKTLRDLEEGSY